MSIENSVFIGNTSATAGGAIAVFYAGEATLVNNTFYNNHATTSGGAIFHNNGKTTIGANLLLANTVGASNTLNDMYGRATTGSVFTNLGYNVYQTTIALGETTQHSFVWNAQDKQIVAPENILSLNASRGYYILTANGNTETRIVPQSFVNTYNMTTDVAGVTRTDSSHYNAGAKEFSITSSVYDIKAQKLTFYPNPVKDILFLTNESVSSVELIDIQGIVIYRGLNVKTINMDSFASGIYFVRVNNGNVQKVVKLS